MNFACVRPPGAFVGFLRFFFFFLMIKNDYMKQKKRENFRDNIYIYHHITSDLNIEIIILIFQSNNKSKISKKKRRKKFKVELTGWMVWCEHP